MERDYETHLLRRSYLSSRELGHVIMCAYGAPRAGIFIGRVLRDTPSRAQCLTCCVLAGRSALGTASRLQDWMSADEHGYVASCQPLHGRRQLGSCLLHLRFGQEQRIRASVHFEETHYGRPPLADRRRLRVIPAEFAGD